MCSNISRWLRTGNILVAVMHKWICSLEGDNVLVWCYCEWSVLHCNAFILSGFSSGGGIFLFGWLTRRLAVVSCWHWILFFSSFLRLQLHHWGSFWNETLLLCWFFIGLWFGVVDQVLRSTFYFARVMVELLPFQGILEEHANISFSLEAVFCLVYYSNWIDGLKLVRFDNPHFCNWWACF